MQQILTKEPQAKFRVLEGPEDKLIYKDMMIQLKTAQDGIERFFGISFLRVRNPLNKQIYYGHASEGQEFIGFGEFYSFFIPFRDFYLAFFIITSFNCSSICGIKRKSCFGSVWK